MGDRTNITDARQHDAEQAAGVIEQAMRNEGLIDKDVRLMGEIITEALDAAGFDVVLRADPDTSDEHKPCPHCNDEGVVCTLDGEIIGPCDCTSDDLFTEARRLLDRWDALDLSDIVDDARPLIAALLAERDADVSAGAVARTVAMSHIAAERDAERAARERAEAEARQLREAIETAESVGVDYCTLHHGIRNEDEHSCDFRDDDQESGDDGEPRECVLVELIPRPPLAVVAEGAEDRGQTDG